MNKMEKWDVKKDVVAVDRINFYARDLRVLKGIRDYSDFYNRVNKIRKIFDFDKEIVIDVFDDLQELENLLIS